MHRGVISIDHACYKDWAEWAALALLDASCQGRLVGPLKEEAKSIYYEYGKI